MKYRSWIALALCLFLLAVGCAGRKADSAAYDAEPSVMAAESAEYDGYTVSSAESTANSTTQDGPADSGTRKIVYTAYLDITADDPAAALTVIMDKAQALGGYVAASYTSNDDDGAAYRSTATLKVPADALETLVTAAKNAGTVDSYELSSDDISLSYYDIRARLDNAEAEEKQLLTLLEVCTSIEDMLAVREQLTSVRSDIESYQAQINLWDNLVDYATLELTCRRTEKTPVEGESSLIEIWKASDVWKNISRGFQNSARFTVNAIGAIGIFLAYAIIPAAILFCCIGVPIIVHHKRKKRRAAECAAIPAADGCASENPPVKRE